MSLDLSPETIEAIAEAVVRRLQGVEMVDAGELARRLGVSRDYVYEHKTMLGGQPIGDGPRPRWRFDVETARAALAESQRPKKVTPRRRRRRAVASVPTQTGGHRGNGPAPDIRR